ncbi:DUF1957 domain-containing protein [Paenibacillus chondroitinus]|uniref:DUF1957 domain-containing protein n=1 Tax=Paenibacillus chondroitinus TaxID=59842 RepID=A0ABU6DNC3_9BACL|nr:MULTISPECIES: 1,4-alpha-glucan branching protein domain-containing protein [Paenibacillus]MCY9660364.1 DUF1957 domain-containing protein [Paenibacillus anseongense]MEB4799271.1 DUF1957 domain-containing protein [Paenibacillus chondroitinus]
MINRLKSKPEIKGYFALVLHAHLPYISHQGPDTALEERWFFEAMTETYLPLLEVMQQLSQDQIDFRMTFSLTPTLLSLFSDPFWQAKYRIYLQKLITLADSEQVRLQQDPVLLPAAYQYSQRFQKLLDLYESYEGNVIVAFKHFQELGHIEIVTSAATHAYLPLMQTEESIRAQILTAVKDFERYFDQKPRGFWLPECGYTPGIERILSEAGIRYIFTDATAVAFASPHPHREQLAPLLTATDGVTAFPCDVASMHQICSPEDGYSSDFLYRDYYSANDAGFKYDRNTSKGRLKMPYHPALASERAEEHADDFLKHRQKQVQQALRWLDRKPVIVSSFQAELFGHWWYEGPHFLEQLCRKMFLDQTAVKMITPSEYLDEYPSAGVGQLNPSSAGRNHSSETWLQAGNDWIYRHLHEAEKRMIHFATNQEHLHQAEKATADVFKRALNQAARELMLAQSSDWAFMMDSATYSDYASRRIKKHLGCFHQLCDQLNRNQIDEDFLAALEEHDNFLPDVEYQAFRSISIQSPIPIIPSRSEWEGLLEATKHRHNVFMLAWEYPPKQVGGLSKAVHELSETLASLGEIVHVITTSNDGAPAFEYKNGVYVHRLPVQHSGDTSFYHWTFEMNLAMTDHLVNWVENGGRIDLLHAHDWMVFHAAREIKMSYNIPLIATIHATEWGRNQGDLGSDLQRKIHQLEWKLTYEANRVFVCSSYMKEEVVRIFSLPPDKVIVHPNGIQLSLASGKETVKRPREIAKQDKVIFYIGRLVYEKGIQTLIHAMPGILTHVPQAKLIIAGSGPMENELRTLAAHLGDRVLFTGFIDDSYRTQLYQYAHVCVIPSLYEPFGIVALEAMASRRPLVLSDTGGLAEIIRHGVDGYKALPGHVDSLAWHITEMLLHPKLAAKMADSAYQLLQKNYQWNHIAANVQEDYRKLTNKLSDIPVTVKS